MASDMKENQFPKHQLLDVRKVITASVHRVYDLYLAQAILQLQKAVTENSKVGKACDSCI